MDICVNRLLLNSVFCVVLSTFPGQLLASAAQPETPQQNCAEGSCAVTYEATFFNKYAPVSALDMVLNLPGFDLDDGDTGSRGFGGAAGNVLINGERISAKNDSPSSILARIPAADVEAIIVLRGQLGGLDLVGQAVIANIIRKGESASGTWRVNAEVNAPDDRVSPYVDLTYTDTIKLLNYTLGLSGGRYQDFHESDEWVLNRDSEVIEQRSETFNDVGDEVIVSLNSSMVLGDNSLAFNAGYSRLDETGGETSIRMPTEQTPFVLFQGEAEKENTFELGFDIERPLNEQWRGKLIALQQREDYTINEALVRGPVAQAGRTDTTTFFNSVSIETIARIELDYSGIEGHLMEFAVEGARNSLESQFAFAELNNGQLQQQEVDGANTRVEEKRLDFNLSDSFRIGAVNVDALLGGESSTITQTGGFSEDRSFFFWKPSVTLTWSPDPQTQWRGRLLRTVGQLDFFDFVSQADLGDVELSLGNPNLSPESTVTLDLTLEKRFGEIGLVSVTAFHDEIDDVVDLLPLEGRLEIPGNIGDGRRSGLRTELTLPMDSVGLNNSRLDVTAYWQTSSVTDPVTGGSRVLSNERGWFIFTTLRQDLIDDNLAWSLTFFHRNDFPQFGLDEIDIASKRYDIDGFVESRAIPGVRLRLGFENILREGDLRDRQVFAGSRANAPLGFRELRQRSLARQLFVDISGAF